MILLLVLLSAALLAVVEHGREWQSRRMLRRLRPWEEATLEHIRRESATPLRSTPP